jgi:WD40 repeat protein
MQTFQLPEGKSQPQSVGFSHDGRLVAVWDRSTVFVIDPSAGTVRTLCRAPLPQWGYVGCGSPGVGFTTDGQGAVAFCVHHPIGGPPAGAVRVYALGSGAVMRQLPLKSYAAVEIGPDSKWVYATVVDGRRTGVLRWDPLTGQTLPAFGHIVGGSCQLTVSTDGRWVVGSRLGDVRVWNMAGKAPPTRASKKLEVGDRIIISALTVSSDGAFLAAVTRGVHVWDVKTGTRWTIAPGSSVKGREAAFHPSQPLLALSGGTPEVTFWDAVSRSEVKRFAWDVGPVTALAFSADGLRCAAAGTGRVVIWDVDV